MRRGLLVLLVIGAVAACGDRRQPSAPVTTATAAKSAPPPDDALVGVVEAPDGVAAPGAVVALNPVHGKRLALVRTDGQGRFRIARPHEPFAITVTDPRGTAVFVPPLDPKSQPSTPHLRLGDAAAGTTIAGTLRLAGGAPPAGTFVSASRVSKDEGDVFFGAVSETGAFALTLPPGTYWLSVDGEGLVQRSVKVSGDVGARAQIVLEASPRAPAPDEVVSWLKEKALPIRTSEPGGATDDLAPLVSAFGNARVIGVGEATHGTREFTRFKHRLVEHLAGAPGGVVVAWEANFAKAEAIDEYLQTGKGTAEDAIRNMFRVWQTDEVLDLLKWIRTYNADPRHPGKIRLKGYDVQGARASLAAVRAYLRRVDPSSEALLGALAPLDADTNTQGMIDLTDAQKTETGAAAASLVDRFAAQRDAYVARSSAAAYALAARHARVIQQAQSLFAAKNREEEFVARDRAMADNVVWLLEQSKPASRVLVWAHNGHVQTDSGNLPGPNMGVRLRERLGPDYLSVGFVLDEGAYRACPDPKKPRETVEVPLAPAPPGDAAEAFARTGIPMFAVDLRDAPRGGVSEWLAAPHVLRSCGWIVCNAARLEAAEPLARMFDIAVYLRRTSAAQPLRR